MGFLMATSKWNLLPLKDGTLQVQRALSTTGDNGPVLFQKDPQNQCLSHKRKSRLSVSTCRSMIKLLQNLWDEGVL